MPANASDGRPARRRSTQIVGIIAATGAAAAMLAPSGLTGYPVIDILERAAFAGGTTFIGAHGRRWQWLVTGALIALPARGVSLWIALAGLSVVVLAAIPRRRSKIFGAVALALLTNAAFWYQPSTSSYAPALATGAFVLSIVGSTRYMRTSVRRRAHVALWATAGSFLAICALVGVAMFFASGHVAGGTRSARLALGSARTGDADLSASRLETAGRDFDDAASIVDGAATIPARLVPGLAQQVRAVRVGVHEGRRITRSASDLVATADYDNLSYKGGIDLGEVHRLQGPTARVAKALGIAQRHLDRLRSGWLLPPLESRLDTFADAVTDARDDASLASDLLDLTPNLLGGQAPRHYLVVFTTPAELRGAGGFVGSFAEIEATGGRTELTRAGRIEELISAVPPGTRKISGPPDYLRRYGQFGPADLLQDATFSPDFPSDAQVLAELYPQSGGRPVDGVINVDPTGLAALLQLTGPVPVDGLSTPLSATNAVDILTRTQYIDLPDRSERGEILTSAVRATFERLTKGALPAPRRLANVLSKPTRGGHLRLWSPRPPEQRLFRRIGAEGALQIPAGADGFSVVQQNAGNNKIDAYLRRRIRYRVRVDARTGQFRSTLEVVLRNDIPTTDLPRSVIGNTRGQPPGTSISTVSIYTPAVLTASRINGLPLKLGPDTELGLNVYDTPLLSIPPGGTVRLELDLAGSVDINDGYRLRVLPQPVAISDRLDVSIGAIDGRLDRDEPGPVKLVEDQSLTTPLTVSVGLIRAD